MDSLRRDAHAWRTLRKLSMENGGGIAGADFVAKAVANCPGLWHVDVPNNAFGDRGAEIIASALSQQKDSRVVWINLARNNIGVEGTLALANMLRTHRGIEALDMDDNAVGEEGANALAAALRNGAFNGVLNLTYHGAYHGPRVAATAVLSAENNERTLEHRQQQSSCSPEATEVNMRHFAQRGGLFASGCPENYHLAAFTACGDGMRKHSAAVLVIGGNTGSDCIGFARLVSGKHAVSFSRWAEDIELVTGKAFPRAMCEGSGGGHGLREYPIQDKGTEVVSPLAGAHVYCVEPLPANFEALNSTAALERWRQHLTIIRAAASDKTPASGSFEFPASGSFGMESAQIGHVFEGRAASQFGKTMVNVRATTIDELVRRDMGGKVPQILSIDAEGFDGLVLRGANQTLRAGGLEYIEFEYHNIGPWKGMQLRDTIDYLDESGYSCYWAQPRLVRITGCWNWGKFANRHEWSNVVCARRAEAVRSKSLEQSAALSGCWAAALEATSFHPETSDAEARAS